MATPPPAISCSVKVYSVMAIDLERMRRADRVFDLGRIAGELQHFYMQATGNKYAAEPFISHFLWEYACHFPDRDRAFHSITGRIPFQMGLTLLRIARNSWVHAAASPTTDRRSEDHSTDIVMDIRALIFDINGTLIDIETDERMEQAYRAIGHFLTYQGITLHRWKRSICTFQIMKEQFERSTEMFPEFDVVAVGEKFRRQGNEFTQSLPPGKLTAAPLVPWPNCSGESRENGSASFHKCWRC